MGGERDALGGLRGLVEMRCRADGLGRLIVIGGGLKGYGLQCDRGCGVCGENAD